MEKCKNMERKQVIQLRNLYLLFPPSHGYLREEKCKNMERKKALSLFPQISQDDLILSQGLFLMLTPAPKKEQVIVRHSVKKQHQDVVPQLD